MERDRGGGRDEQDRAGIVGGRSPILTPTARDDGVAGDAQPFGRVVEIGGKDDDERRRHDASPHCRRASRTGASRASNRAVSRLVPPPSRTLGSTANPCGLMASCAFFAGGPPTPLSAPLFQPSSTQLAQASGR